MAHYLSGFHNRHLCECFSDFDSDMNNWTYLPTRILTFHFGLAGLLCWSYFRLGQLEHHQQHESSEWTTYLTCDPHF